MNTSTITIDVQLDKDKIPQQINWKAGNGDDAETQEAKAFMLSFWDGADKSALRIDLWTKDMMVDEMADFFYQTIMTMADAYNRATHQEDLTADMKNFARDFYNKFRASQAKENS